MTDVLDNPSHILLRYLDLEQAWLKLRNSGAGPSTEEDALADRMDEAWEQLSVDERLALNGRR
jgi:hypothetical protein